MAENLFSRLGKIFILPEGLGPIRIQMLRANVVQNGGDLASKLDSTISIICVHESVSTNKIDELLTQCQPSENVCVVDIRWMFLCISEGKLSMPSIRRGKSSTSIFADISEVKPGESRKRANDEDCRIERSGKREHTSLQSTQSPRETANASPHHPFDAPHPHEAWTVDLGSGVTVCPISLVSISESNR